MSDFLTDLRRSVVDAHAAHGRRRRSARLLRALRIPLRLTPLLAVPAAVALLAIVAVLGRDTVRVVEPRVIAEIRVGGSPSGAAFADGSLWVTDYTGRALLQLDPDARRVQHRIPLEGTPEAISAGNDGALWVRVGRSDSDATELIRVDTSTRRTLDRVPVGPDVPIAATPDAVWAAVRATDDDRPREGLYRIDARTGRSRRIPIVSVGSLAAAGDTLWALRTNGRLVSVDPASGARRHRFPGLVPAAGATAGAHALAAHDDRAWVLSTTPAGRNTLAEVRDDRVTVRARVDARLQPLLASIGPVLASVIAEPGGGFALARLDPAGGAVLDQVELGEHRPLALLAADQRLWVLTANGRVLVVDPGH